MNNRSDRSYCCFTEEDSSINKLIGEIAVLLANAINKENDSKGVAQGYRAILFSLAESDGVTQLEIAKRVGIKPPTVSVALAKMESEGYVTRTHLKGDLRKTVVTLTDKGRDVVNDMLGVFFDCDKSIAKVLTDEELATLKNLLVVVKERIFKEKEEKCEE